MSSETEYEAVKILKETPQFMGVDLQEYGPYQEGDKVELPEDNADILVNRGNAERIDVYDESELVEIDDGFRKWNEPSDSSDDKYRLWEMQFRDCVAELYVEEVEVEELEKTLHIVFLEDSNSEEKKEIAVDFNAVEAENLAEDYQRGHSHSDVKQEIEELRGENPE